MPKCIKCNYNFPEKELNDGYCTDCVSPEVIRKEQIVEVIRREKSRREEELRKEKIDSIFVTTETFIDVPIEKRICIVSAQCVYGINIIKDLFNFVRDIVGGRIGSIESGLNQANETILKELKEKVILNGGDAIIGVKIEHTYNNANGGSILSVFATGTVVKFSLMKN
ncbi:YbjQ family protein [Sulfurimonas sp.]|uniref:YbjQ family protein n=1 Tax=Sulfurimonas sp. TaxID=2022749 RepID=UPI002AAF73D8|nr:heavy metal-binding domain-containing protein [Sulfurimonas sp.]